MISELPSNLVNDAKECQPYIAGVEIAVKVASGCVRTRIWMQISLLSSWYGAASGSAMLSTGEVSHSQANVSG